MPRSCPPGGGRSAPRPRPSARTAGSGSRRHRLAPASTSSRRRDCAGDGDAHIGRRSPVRRGDAAGTVAVTARPPPVTGSGANRRWRRRENDPVRPVTASGEAVDETQSGSSGRHRIAPPSDVEAGAEARADFGLRLQPQTRPKGEPHAGAHANGGRQRVRGLPAPTSSSSCLRGTPAPAPAAGRRLRRRARLLYALTPSASRSPGPSSRASVAVRALRSRR